jgi:hypothetical protein
MLRSGVYDYYRDKKKLSGVFVRFCIKGYLRYFVANEL